MSDFTLTDNAAVLALLAFALWAIALVLLVVTLRSAQVMAGGKKLTDFPSGVRHGGDFYWRVNRAHANTVENLPIFASVVFAGTTLNVSGETFSTLALTVAGARVVQSLIHMASGAGPALMLRFSFYAVQLVAIVWMAVLCLRAV